MMADRQPPDIQADRVSRTACPECASVVDLSGAEPFSVVQCPRCKAKFAAPAKLGQFVLLKRLGAGEMGATYKAYDKKLKRHVAIKVMRRALGADRRRTKDFLAEGRALASLDHPNAVRVFSFGEQNGQPYIVMELVTGRSLDRMFAADEPLEEDRALEIAIEVAEALAAAGRIGLIHGDVKPANIMIDNDGRAKLVDFGIARFGGAQADQDGVLGTPYYLAPEQVRREPADHRTDVYSLGATLFHALTGRPPFPGTDVKQVLQARLVAPAPDVLAVRPSLHPRTAAVVAKMLQADPDRRYATHEELLEDLQTAYQWVVAPQVQEAAAPAAPATPATPAAPAAPAAPARRRRLWIVGAGVGVAALVAIGLVVWAVAFRGDSRQQDEPAARIPVAGPVFSPPGRTLGGPTDVVITCNTTGARIHYTLDGGEPTEQSPLYVRAIPIRPGTTLKARAFLAGRRPSSVIQAVYPADSVTVADVVPLRTDAEAAWKAVKDLDRGQGLAALLDRGEKLGANAEELYRRLAYGEAKRQYEQLLAVSKRLAQLGKARDAAAAARDRAGSARKSLAELDKHKRVASHLAEAGKAAGSAAEVFERGRFDEAQLLWRSAEAHAGAGAAKLMLQARSQWDKALDEEHRKRLEAHGGSAWRDVKDALARAQQAEKQRQLFDAVRNYRLALKLLPKATDALEKGSIEAEKNRRLTRARALMAEGKYRAALAEVQQALKIKPTSKSSARLKRQIEEKLTARIDAGGGRTIHLVLIPPGTFRMGSPATEKGRGSNERLHPVTISRPFYIGKREVTRRQFSAFASRQRRYPGYKTQAEQAGFSHVLLRGQWVGAKGMNWQKPGFEQKEDHPVVCVTWKDAKAFCDWLGKKVRKTVRLPTEAEWEYACRAGTQTPFSFGDDEDALHKHANYADKSARLTRRDARHDDGYAFTAPVGRFRENAWGLCDVHGNVREWCADRYGEYPGGSVTDPTGPEKGNARVVRGGAWNSLAIDCRSAERTRMVEDRRTPFLGFRIVVEGK